MIGKIMSTGKMLEKSLDVAQLRNNTISNNISNIDTPGYKGKKVMFEDFLQDAVNGKTYNGRHYHPKHIPIGGSGGENVTPLVVDNPNANMRLDGNSVDIDSEMADLAKNTAKYNTLVQLMNSSLSGIKSVITGGR